MAIDAIGILIEEQDGNPSGFCTKLIASNASLTNNGDGSFTLTTGGGVSDHGALTGLSDDDHSVYALLAGRSGGQELKGGTDSGDDLTLTSTNHATKGNIDIGVALTVDEVNERVGINTASNALTAQLTIQGTGGEGFYIERHSANANEPSQKFWKSRGSVASPSKLNDGDRTGKIEFWGYARNSGDSADAYARTGYIRSIVDGVDAQDRIGGAIEFWTCSGTSLAPTQKLSVDNQSVTIHKIATATAGTQYDSWDLYLTGSVWDTDNTQAEDRTWTIVNDCGSGADGSEPYYLQVKDNDGTVLFSIDPLTPAVDITQYLRHYGDANTAIEFMVDRVKIISGGIVMMDAQEAAQDSLYIACGALGVGGDDVDVYMGTNQALKIAGDTGIITFETRIKLSETGTQDFYSYEGSVADEGTVDLPDALAGFVFITFDEGAEYAFCNVTDAAVVTLISNSTNVDNSDTDTGDNYCIFDNGTSVRLKNYTGSAKNFKIIAFMG